ncbi:MAG: 2TM domain-containing protein [Acidimicrobiales bacterium]
MSTHDQNHQTQAVNEYPQQVRAFQVHASVFAASIVLIFAVNLFVNLAAGIAGQWSAWWSVWALIGWGLGIAVHGFVVWLARPASSPLAHDGGAAR